jgi:hypothetical protein
VSYGNQGTYSQTDLLLEAREAFEKVWFIQSVRQTERTDVTLSLRLYVREDLFVQAFVGEITGSVYFALIDGGRRIFGMDFEKGEWHLHPHEAPHRHEPLKEGLDPKPLLRFLATVESLLVDSDLL